MLYRTLVRPMLSCGSECWPVSKKNGNMLRIFEIRILRMSFGPINGNGIWRTRYSNELYTHFDGRDLVSGKNRKIEVAGTPLQNTRTGSL